MSEGPWMTACRWLLVSALASFCLWKGAGTASAYLESAGAGSYTDCWREAARNAPGHRIALLCKDATALVVAAVLGCIALNHTLLEPNGLGTYGGKAKLLLTCEGLPRDYFTTVAGNALQPSYPPGMTLLAYFHFLLSGGCGDRLVQLLEAFAMGLVCIGLLRGGSGPRAAVPVALYLLSPMAIRTTSGFYAEPFAALALLAGWDRLVRGGFVGGGLVLGLAGMFRPEAGVVAVAFALAGCWGQGVRRSLTSAAVAALPAFAWMVTARLLGYGGVQDWDFLSVPRFGQMGYALLCEATFLGVTAVPVALVLYLVRPLHRPCIDRPARRALLADAALMLIVPILCGFHASSHAAWMMDNTVPRFAWYVLAVPLGALARCAVTQRSSGAEERAGAEPQAPRRSGGRVLQLSSRTQLLCFSALRRRRMFLFSFGAVRGSITEDTERPLRGNAEELRSRRELGRYPRNRGDRPRTLGNPL